MSRKSLIAKRSAEILSPVLWLVLACFIPNAAWYCYLHPAGSVIGNPPEFFFVSSFNALPYIVVSLIVLRFIPRLPGLVLLGAFLFLLSLATWIGVAHYLIFQYPINSTSIYISLNSNLAETGEFIRSYRSVPILCCLLALLAPQLMLFPLIVRERAVPARMEKAAMVAVWLVFLSPLWTIVSAREEAFANDNPCFVYQKAIRQYLAEIGGIRKSAAQRTGGGLCRVTTLPRPATRKETYLLVIGESTSRNHMRIYGYGRDTTPQLTAVSGEMYRFDDVISPHAHTIPVLQKALTVRDPGISDQIYSTPRLFGAEVSRCPDLFSIMKKGGFRTFWLSNQTVSGEFDLWNTFFSEGADRRVFTNTGRGDSYDDKLLPYLKGALADPAPLKLIVLHLMGNHLYAGDRFPKSFAAFSRDGSPPRQGLSPRRSANTLHYIDCYDDAVRYTDAFLGRALAELKGQDGVRMMIFFSDHGEEVGEIGDFWGHMDTRPSRFMYEIPFLLWTSPEYLEARPEVAAQLPKAVSRPYETDDFMHTLMDLTGVWIDGFSPQKSLLNRRFLPKRRLLYGRDYEELKSGQHGPVMARKNEGKSNRAVN